MTRMKQIAVLVAAVAVTSCAASMEFDRARVGVSVLRNLPGEQSEAAAAQELIADQAVLALAGGDAEKAVAALRSLGVSERDARRRVLAAQAAGEGAK